MTDADEAGQRRAFRAWVRSHHPDAGGDPDEFVAGLARWRAQASRIVPGGPSAAGPVTVFRARGGLWRAQRWWRRRHQAPRVKLAAGA